MAICKWCEQDFNSVESDAHDTENYCSEEHEQYAEEEDFEEDEFEEFETEDE